MGSRIEKLLLMKDSSLGDTYENSVIYQQTIGHLNEIILIVKKLSLNGRTLGISRTQHKMPVYLGCYLVAEPVRRA